MTLQELRAMRDESQKDMDRRLTEGKTIEVIVGMGTCGIAAGGKETLAAFVEELSSLGVKGVTIKQTGCMGLCYAEPTVEVRMPGMPGTIYGNVDAATARTIVSSHIVGKKLVDKHVFDRPAKDIVKEK
jgi:NADP-reducing hydrogenase subunit HndB